MSDQFELSGLIYCVHGRRVMLSDDLARLYEVEPRALIQAVKRNRERFPRDFLFQLTREEFADLKSQFVISSWGGRRSNPYAFTEQGVAMLSSVLRSKRAVRANIAIMRAFVKIREISAQNREILAKLDQLEHRVDRHEADIGALIDAIREGISGGDPEESGRKIGFQVD